MGRGMLTTEEIRILKENPYVKEVHGSRIVYSDEFKTRFIQEQRAEIKKLNEKINKLQEEAACK